MAMTVIMTFGENATAETFVQRVHTAQTNETGFSLFEPGAVGLMVLSGAQLDAVVARPTHACECYGKGRIPPSGKYSNDPGYFKTEHFGWMVHRGAKGKKCKRPTITIVRNFIKNMIVTAGNNLLQEILDRSPSVQEQSAPATDTIAAGPTDRVDGGYEDVPAVAMEQRTEEDQAGPGATSSLGIRDEEREAGPLDAGPGLIWPNEEDFTFKVPSKSDATKVYDVRVWLVDTGIQVQCPCDGFKYRGSCSHSEAIKMSPTVQIAWGNKYISDTYGGGDAAKHSPA